MRRPPISPLRYLFGISALTVIPADPASTRTARYVLTQIRQESKIIRAFVLRALVGFHIEVNAVEPFPRVLTIELHDALDSAQ
jgi:hypothetical protein